MKRMLNSRLIIFITLCILFSSMSYGITEDTISMGNQIVALRIPQPNRLKIYNYEEGFFKTIMCITDSCLIDLHWGFCVNYPLIKLSDKTIYYESSNYIVHVTKSWMIVNGQIKYFREDNYFNQKIDITYEFVPQHRLHFYEEILNSARIHNKKSNFNENIQH